MGVGWYNVLFLGVVVVLKVIVYCVICFVMLFLFLGWGDIRKYWWYLDEFFYVFVKISVYLCTCIKNRDFGIWWFKFGFYLFVCDFDKFCCVLVFFFGKEKNIGMFVCIKWVNIKSIENGVFIYCKYLISFYYFYYRGV